MKTLPILLSTMMLGTAPAYSHGWGHHTHHVYETGNYTYYNDHDHRTCTKQRVDVTYYSDGTHVKDFNREPIYSCIEARKSHKHYHIYRSPTRQDPPTHTPSPDGNECKEGAILGGILGGGAGAALSQGDGRWWAIPLGIASGAVIGCDIDGG